MFGGSTYGELAYSEQDHVTASAAAFEAFLAEINSPRCWLLEIDAFSLATDGELSAAYGDAGAGIIGYAGDSPGVTGGVVTQRFGTHGYISKQADSPAFTFYEPRLTGEMRVERMITGRDGIGGLVSVYAEVRLVNADGELDTITRDYALDGRPATLLIGRFTDARADFGTVFKGVVQQATIGNVVTLRLSDGLAKLNVPANPNTFAGTGDLEGGADLKGKSKPKGWGHVFNIAPPLVDSARLIYQVSDGAISDVPNCWDRQIALTQGADYADAADLLANAPAAGTYRVYKGGGYIRLGSTPSGTVTCDLLGDAAGGIYVNKTADILLRILVNQALLFSTEIDPSTFADLNDTAPAEVGIWTGTEPRTCAELVDELLYGIGAWGGFSRLGYFSVGLVASATEEAAEAVYTDETIGEAGIERVPLPQVVEPVIWRARVGWQRNYTVQTDVAAGVTAARRTFAAEPWRTSESKLAAIQSQHLLAKDLGPVPSLYALQADADAEALRLFNLWSPGRGLFRVKPGLSALARDLGHVVELQHARHGFTPKRPVRVLGHSIKGSEVELLVLA